MEEEHNRPPFSLVESVIMVLIILPFDAFQFFSALTLPVPVLGVTLVFFSWFSGLAAWAVIQFWLIMKGQKGTWFLAGNLLEFAGFSFLNWLPLMTVTLIITIALANKQAKGGIVGKAIGAVGKATGGTIKNPIPTS